MAIGINSDRLNESSAINKALVILKSLDLIEIMTYWKFLFHGNKTNGSGTHAISQCIEKAFKL